MIPHVTLNVDAPPGFVIFVGVTIAHCKRFHLIETSGETP